MLIDFLVYIFLSVLLSFSNFLNVLDFISIINFKYLYYCIAYIKISNIKLNFICSEEKLLKKKNKDIL